MGTTRCMNLQIVYQQNIKQCCEIHCRLLSSLHLYQIDENAALDTHMRNLMFLIFSSINYYNINIVKTCCINKMANSEVTSPNIRVVLRRLTHEDHELKYIPDYLLTSMLEWITNISENLFKNIKIKTRNNPPPFHRRIYLESMIIHYLLLK